MARCALACAPWGPGDRAQSSQTKPFHPAWVRADQLRCHGRDLVQFPLAYGRSSRQPSPHSREFARGEESSCGACPASSAFLPVCWCSSERRRAVARRRARPLGVTSTRTMAAAVATTARRRGMTAGRAATTRADRSTAAQHETAAARRTPTRRGTRIRPSGSILEQAEEPTRGRLQRVANRVHQQDQRAARDRHRRRPPAVDPREHRRDEHVRRYAIQHRPRDEQRALFVHQQRARVHVGQRERLGAGRVRRRLRHDPGRHRAVPPRHVGRELEAPLPRLRRVHGVRRRMRQLRLLRIDGLRVRPLRQHERAVLLLRRPFERPRCERGPSQTFMRQVVSPAASRISTPIASSSPRTASARAKSFAARAAVRSATFASIAAASSPRI